MLHTLVDHAKRLNLHAEAGFIPKVVRWLIEFDETGRFLGVIEQSDPEGGRRKGRAFQKAPNLKFSGDSPLRQFLVDTAHYALLYGVEKPDKKLLAKHGFFLDLLHQAATADPVFAVLFDALSEDTIRSKICVALEERKAKPPDNVTFAVHSADGGVRVPVEESCWHDWWREFFPTLLPEKGGNQGDMVCLLTGKLTEAARTHPKIKGLGGVGGKVETAMVAFNEDAFESYGLSQSYNAAVGKQAAEQYAATLNHLIEHNSVTLAGAKVVYWYDRQVERGDDPVQSLLTGIDFGEAEVSDKEQEQAEPSERDVAQAEDRARALLDAIRTGKRPDLADSRYYAVTLSGNSARVVVRDWMEGQFTELAENIAAWFEDLAIVRRDGVDLVRSHKFAAVLAAAVRDLKDIPGPSVAALWHAAIRQRPIPHNLAAQTLARVKIDVIQDDSPRHARLGLLRAFLVRNGDTDMKPHLNEDHPSPAYHCGRLLAVLAYIQYVALGDVGAGVVQRYYAAASATPALVLGRLARTAQFHLDKIADKKIRFGLDKRLAEIWGRIDDSIPSTLTLEQQTIFALGYYHQKAYRGPSADSE